MSPLRPRRADRRFPVRVLLSLLSPLSPLSPLLAQDTIPPVEQGVRIGITYTPGTRAGMLVLGGTETVRLDSVRAILRRDLDYSDQFELISLPGSDSLMLGILGSSAASGAGGTPFVNYSLYAALGADYAAAVLPGEDTSFVFVTLYDVRGVTVRHSIVVPLAGLDQSAFRMAVHQAADEMVRAASGEPGTAASRLLFVRRGRVYQVDSDGAGLLAISPSDVKTFSPVWDPTSPRVAYTELYEGWGRLVVHDLDSGARSVVAPTAELLNYASVFAPDGQVLAFARSGAAGTDIYAYNLARDCCLERLTVGRFSDNLSPTFSPDGRQVAFVSTRAGLPQIYVMAADGTRQELFAPFDYGVTGSSNAPEWSRDGVHLTFHRDVVGSPQVFVMEIRSRAVRQLTSAGRNEDPTWAPDGRHIAFISNRTGTRQVWVIDVGTGRVRQLTTVGEARLPAWSPRIPASTKP